MVEAHPCCNTTMNVKKHVSEIGINGVNQPELANLREEMANGTRKRELQLQLVIVVQKLNTECFFYT